MPSKNYYRMATKGSWMTTSWTRVYPIYNRICPLPSSCSKLFVQKVALFTRRLTTWFSFILFIILFLLVKILLLITLYTFLWLSIRIMLFHIYWRDLITWHFHKFLWLLLSLYLLLLFSVWLRLHLIWFTKINTISFMTNSLINIFILLHIPNV